MTPDGSVNVAALGAAAPLLAVLTGSNEELVLTVVELRPKLERTASLVNEELLAAEAVLVAMLAVSEKRLNEDVASDSMENNGGGPISAAVLREEAVEEPEDDLSEEGVGELKAVPVEERMGAFVEVLIVESAEVTNGNDNELNAPSIREEVAIPEGTGTELTADVKVASAPESVVLRDPNKVESVGAPRAVSVFHG